MTHAHKRQVGHMDFFFRFKIAMLILAAGAVSTTGALLLTV